MSANVYTIESLLMNKPYRSNTLTGEIVDAEKSTQPLWYGNNKEAYLVRVRDNFANYHYRTVVVNVA